jgi:hypothetical protein
MLVIFFDPESDMGAAFWPAMQTPLRLVSEAERADLMRGVDEFRSMGAPTRPAGPGTPP